MPRGPEAISADSEQYPTRFDGLLERAKNLADPQSEGHGTANYETESLVVGEQDDQALSLQFYIFAPQPPKPESDYQTNYEPSILAKWFLGDGATQTPQVVKRRDYLSKKHLRDTAPGYDEETAAQLLEQFDHILALYEKARPKQKTDS